MLLQNLEQQTSFWILFGTGRLWRHADFTDESDSDCSEDWESLTRSLHSLESAEISEKDLTVDRQMDRLKIPQSGVPMNFIGTAYFKASGFLGFLRIWNIEKTSFWSFKSLRSAESPDRLYRDQGGVTDGKNKLAYSCRSGSPHRTFKRS